MARLLRRQPAQQPAQDALPRDVWVVAGVVVVGMAMVILDTTIVNVALESLSRDLNSPLSTIQWVSSGYLLALAVVIPLAGWMTERFGSKRVWITSVAMFGLGSALAGLAWSDSSLIFFRVLQGLGGGMTMPVGMTLLAQTAGPQRVGRVMSVVGVPMLLAPVLGPVIGGAIVDSISWRWIFFVNVPVAAIGVALATRLLSPDSGRIDAGRLDWRGFLLLSPGLVGLVFGLSEVAIGGGVGAPLAFGPILAGLALICAFAIYSLRAPRPLIDVRLFGARRFSLAAAATFCIAAALFGAMLVLPLYYQLAGGASPLAAGLLLAPQGLGAAMVMPISGRLTDRIGGGRVALFGTVVMTLGTVPFAFVGPHTSDSVLAAALMVRGVGFGAAMMPAMAAAFAVLSPGQVPRATSALNALQRTGGAVGTALMAVVLEHQLAGTGSGSPAALAAAFGHTFWWAIGLSAAAIVPAAILAMTPRRDRVESATAPVAAAA